MGVVIPAGVSIYPFPERRFGLQMELAPILEGGNNYNNLLRGSWGIRYRFGVKEE